MRRVALLIALALVAACATGGGGSGGGDDDDGGDGDPDGGAVTRDCRTHFRYQAAADVTGVALAGAWDWSTTTPLLDDDGDRSFELATELPAGLWQYKLVVSRADGEAWILDPENPYRAYDSGVENSAARVPDCALPELVLDGHELDGDRARFTLRFVAGQAGAPLDPAALEVTVLFGFDATPVTATVEGVAIEIALEGLAAGKHTVRVVAADREGRAAGDLVLPFWIEDEPFEWRGAPIYMVMTDRFADGDLTNDPEPALGAEPAADFHGGDLAGVTAAIEDGTFDALGVRALWLSPLVRNTDGVYFDGSHGVTGFHGYWPTEPRAVDPRLGDDAALEALVRAAHERGMRVLLDYVINHVHEDHVYATEHPDWLRTGCLCGTPGCDWTERRLDCSFRTYLPDVNWQVPEAGEQMIADALWWLERFDLDGLRVDAVKHVEDAAIGNLATRVSERLEGAGTDYFLLGETAMGWGGDDVANSLGDYATIARYLGEHALSGQFDFVLYHATGYRVFADQARGAAHLDYWTRMSLEHYPADAVMTPFVGSHDSERLISLATYGSGSELVHHKWADEGLPAAPTTDLPYQRAALALTWLLSTPGAPLLYYGDEYGEHGGGDPDNRHMWRGPAERSTRETALHTRVARAGQARRKLAALRRGDYRPLLATEELLVFARVDAGDAALVVINLGGGPVATSVAIPAEVPLAGALYDHLDPDAPVRMLRGDSLTIELPARSAAIFSPVAP